MAEGVGFEPTVPFDTPVFKTGALNHYATPPMFNTLTRKNFKAKHLINPVQKLHIHGIGFYLD